MRRTGRQPRRRRTNTHILAGAPSGGRASQPTAERAATNPRGRSIHAPWRYHPTAAWTPPCVCRASAGRRACGGAWAPAAGSFHSQACSCPSRSSSAAAPAAARRSPHAKTPPWRARRPAAARPPGRSRPAAQRPVAYGKAKGKRRPRKAAPCRVRHALPRRSKRGHILWGDCDQRARRETWKRAAQRLPRAPTSPSCCPWKRVECPLRLQSAALGHPAAQQHAVGVKAEARRAFEVCSALEAAHLPRRAAASLRCIWLPRQPQRCGAKPRHRRRHGPPGQQPDLCPEEVVRAGS